MSSNMHIKKVCQHCNAVFIARTTVTKYCGSDCAKKAYKERKRKERLEESRVITKNKIEKPIVELNTKDYLTIKEVCQLLAISRSTLWRSVKNKDIPSIKIGRRTLFKRADVDYSLNRLMS